MSLQKEIFHKIDQQIMRLELHVDPSLPVFENSFEKSAKKIIDTELAHADPSTAKRIREEFLEYGPLNCLLEDSTISEILVNDHQNIWIEKNGQLHRYPDQFYSHLSYQRLLAKICHEANVHCSLNSPSGNGKWKGMRLHVVQNPISPNGNLLSLRRHPHNPWTFERLCNENWCTPEEQEGFQLLIHSKLNFLVVGQTSAGKTSVLNSFLQQISQNERVGIIEDTDEIYLPPGPSFKLLTRQDPHQQLQDLDQGYLVRQCLRMRPDRLLMGEIRGAEAKDFLLALATGHRGSFGSLHAENATQALIRLEMLIQMGAPQWTIAAIRKLMHSSLNMILCCGKNTKGQRQFTGAYRIVSLEETGFVTEKINLRSFLQQLVTP